MTIQSTRARVLAGVLLCGVSALAVSSAAQVAAPMRWYKGNTHTQTINQGGDSTPDEVVRWYRSHGYQFLVLTDHNFLTSVEGLNAVHGAEEKFLVVPGEEVTSRSGNKPVHVNGLDLKGVVEAAEGGSVIETLQRNIDGIRAASGVPHINHPNFNWGLTSDDLRQAKNYKLFEIHNAPEREQPRRWRSTRTRGGVGRAAHERNDGIRRCRGRCPRVQGAWQPARLRSRAWVGGGSRAPSRGRRADGGDGTRRLLRVHRRRPGRRRAYRFTGDEGYVRAKVIESNGRFAWVQPVPVSRRLTSGG
jgi:hypothetical protein